MSNRFRCDHCGKPLFALEPGKLTTFGAVSVWLGRGSSHAVVECPVCGRDTPIPDGTLGLCLADLSLGLASESTETGTIH